jgi:hypothetical protein
MFNSIEDRKKNQVPLVSFKILQRKRFEGLLPSSTGGRMRAWSIALPEEVEFFPDPADKGRGWNNELSRDTTHCFGAQKAPRTKVEGR